MIPAKIVSATDQYGLTTVTLRYEQDGTVWFQYFRPTYGPETLFDVMGVGHTDDLVGMPCLMTPPVLVRGGRNNDDVIAYVCHSVRGASLRCNMMAYGPRHQRTTTKALAAKYQGLPVALVDALSRYAIKRQETGSFLRACLENRFIDAALKADHQSRKWFPEIARFIYNELTSKCWGSPEAVRAWLEGEGEPRMDLESGPVDGISNA